MWPAARDTINSHYSSAIRTPRWNGYWSAPTGLVRTVPGVHLSGETSPILPYLTAISSARMLMAISWGEIAPMFSPTGA